MKLLYGLTQNQMYEVSRAVDINECKKIIKIVSKDKKEINLTEEELEKISESLTEFRHNHDSFHISKLISDFLGIDEQ